MAIGIKALYDAWKAAGGWVYLRDGSLVRLEDFWKEYWSKQDMSEFQRLYDSPPAPQDAESVSPPLKRD